jgi:prolyl-tRNA editing enzyme YbaK/EbsC (Cys-tRNA(Pro) deacylase)
MATIPARLQKYLDGAKKPFTAVEHKTVFTAYDLGQTLKRKLEEIAKTLLVKTDGGYSLVVVRASDRLNLVRLKKALGAKKLAIAKEGDMAKTLKVKPGALTPFAGLHHLPLVVDKKLTTGKKVLFGSGSFERSVEMKVKDFLALEHPTVAAFSESAPPADRKERTRHLDARARGHHRAVPRRARARPAPQPRRAGGLPGRRGEAPLYQIEGAAPAARAAGGRGVEPRGSAPAL